MTGYLINFAVYTLAMVGVIFLALMVFKKTALNQHSQSNTKTLSVEESISLSPRKSLYIIKAGMERFLIASDIERTTMLSKLNSNSIQKVLEETPEMKKEILSESISKIIAEETQPHKSPVMKSLMKKLQKG